ncbi:hypothetical protein LPJ38_23535 [Bradyrhizobium daqingense]|uniref:Uncharacterized protein n=1 Tax=Bradyrhizobium daqingense TaxID=993502 RepID=A0A562LFP3_9BRAD|nr:hypothetical protein [Bradyrhizobium daqingense]TWI06442.1 hypothetical protein IQ17_02657 [Bradyrhizobium daqingense]UFS86635.1 hypothetical protein LPJ38_23535 [Bradyrhizobium daqingense]
MFENVPRRVLVGLFILVLLPCGAGTGWGLAVLLEHISGLSIGYISAVVGGVVGTLGAALWGIGQASELLGLGLIFSEIRIPPRPSWLPPDQKEE